GPRGAASAFRDHPGRGGEVTGLAWCPGFGFSRWGIHRRIVSPTPTLQSAGRAWTPNTAHDLTVATIRAVSHHIYFAEAGRAVHGRIVRGQLRPKFRLGDVSGNDPVELVLSCSQVFADDLPEGGSIVDRPLKVTAGYAEHRAGVSGDPRNDVARRARDDSAGTAGLATP